ncbi:MAG: hypothetical protein WBQ72_20185 [Terriglobales bacterium]|jgi:hypothetical protein
MNEQTQSTPTGHTHEHCPCCEIADAVSHVLGVSPAVKQHLANSRVEFLKAIREMINTRIEHLSSQPSKGTRVAVE